jgi:two-component system sensor histidine kinase/response regulator
MPDFLRRTDDSMTDEPVNILVVDDSPQKLLALQVVLAELRQKVVTALSGEEALRLCLTNEFAVILLDVNMPGMDGFETASLIRQRRQSEHTPIIFVTAMSEETHAAEGYSLGAVDYVLAPVIPEVLRAKVSVFVELHRKNLQVRRQADQRVELVRAEAARAEAEQANRSKSQFLANVSHELRTPMNAVIGMTDLALEEEISPTVREYLQTARDSAGVLMALLDEILDLSRLESGRFELETVSFDPRSVIEQTVRALAIRAHQKGLELACDVTADLPARVMGDPLRLRQVLTNLISNAVKFTETGEVVVEVMCEWGLGDTVVLTCAVRDTGIGISRADQQRVFAPFTQAASSTTRLYGGSGLGLAIASNLVAMMGGHIDVESELGKGSSFQFTIQLPIAAPPLPISRSLDGRRVLLGVHHATTQRAIQRLLNARGADVSVACDEPATRVAFDEGNAAKFDAMILDRSLPGLDLVAFRQRLAALKPSPAVVVLAAPADRRHLPAPTSATEAWAVVDKPVLGPEVGNVIERILAGHPPDKRSAASPLKLNGEDVPALRVLVAEDTPANQVLIERILARRGHKVKIVENGQDAVTAAGADQFDVILMDVQMPVMGGLEAAEAIRAQMRRDHRRVPIVALTAHAMQGDERRCLDAGMDAYVTKPIDVRKLVELVEHVGRTSPAPVAELN